MDSLASGSNEAQPPDQKLKSLKAGWRIAGTQPATQQPTEPRCNIPKLSTEDGLDIIITGSNVAQSWGQELKSLKAGRRMPGRNHQRDQDAMSLNLARRIAWAVTKNCDQSSLVRGVSSLDTAQCTGMI